LAGEAAPIILQMDAATVHEKVIEYYGKDIKTTADLKTSACLTVRRADQPNLLIQVFQDAVKTPSRYPWTRWEHCD
jgi:hypothetical protein